jgi:Antitoxin MazE-like
MPRPAKNIEDQLLRENPKLRDQGLRPVVVWVPDADAPGFKENMRRQIKAINRSRDNEDVLEFLDRAAEDLFEE